MTPSLLVCLVVQNCDYVEDSQETDWCVYRNAVKEVKDKAVITQACIPGRLIT
jgi:hypothetical protein